MILKTTTRTDFANAPKFRAIVERGLRHGVSYAAVVLQEQMIKTMQVGGKARESVSVPGSPPVVQRGGLRNSITSGRGLGISAWAGANVPYAAILERGGAVWGKPRGHGYLTIPLTPAAARMRQVSGSLRNSPTKMRAVKTKNGKLFLVRVNKNKKAKLRPDDWLFILKKYIYIRPRPWAKPSLVAAGPRMLREFSRVAGGEIRGQVLGALRREVSGGGSK